MQNLFNAISRRWESGKPLIVITNKTIDELKGVEDLTLKRINDRILVMCTPIYVGGSSRRRVKADENFKHLGETFGKRGFKHE